MISMKKLSIVIAGTALSFVYLNLKAAHAHHAVDHDLQNDLRFPDSYVEKRGDFKLVEPDKESPTSYWGDVEVRTILGNGEATMPYTSSQLTIPQLATSPLQNDTDKATAFYVLGGNVQLKSGDQTVDLTPGAFSFIPEGTPYQFTNTAATMAKLLELSFPAEFGKEEFLGKDKFLVVPGNIPPKWAEAGVGYNILATEDQTGGRLGIFDIYAPADQGPPWHIHNQEDEGFCILEGDLMLGFEGKTTLAHAGTCGYLPKGRVHEFYNPGNTLTRAVAYNAPGGFEKYFIDVGQPLADWPNTPIPGPDFENEGRIARNYAIDFGLPDNSTSIPEPGTGFALLGFSAYFLTGFVLKRKQHKRKLANLDMRALQNSPRILQ